MQDHPRGRQTLAQNMQRADSWLLERESLQAVACKRNPRATLMPLLLGAHTAAPWQMYNHLFMQQKAGRGKLVHVHADVFRFHGCYICARQVLRVGGCSATLAVGGAAASNTYIVVVVSMLRSI